MALWHADIRLPEGAALPNARIGLDWGRHAQRARLEDRYGVIPQFASIPLSQFQVIEVETDHTGYVTKWVVRGHFDAERDVVMVLIPECRPNFWFVKTVWFNLRSDTHSTLDRSRYQA
jgi:hypothetical protein